MTTGVKTSGLAPGASKELRTGAKALKEAAELVALLEKIHDDPGAWPERSAATKRLAALRAKLDLASCQGLMDRCLGELSSSEKEVHEGYRRRFGRELAETLLPLGFELTGQYPSYYAGPFGIRVDSARGRASIDFGPDTILREQPSAPKIAKALVELKKELLERPLDEDGLLERVFLAWQRARKLAGLTKGRGGNEPRQAILGVLAELNWVSQARGFALDPTTKGFKAVTRQALAWDLYRLRRARRLSAKGQRLILHAAVYDETRKRDDYLWVPDDEKGNGTRYSALSFREEA